MQIRPKITHKKTKQSQPAWERTANHCQNRDDKNTSKQLYTENIWRPAGIQNFPRVRDFMLVAISPLLRKDTRSCLELESLIAFYTLSLSTCCVSFLRLLTSVSLSSTRWNLIVESHEFYGHRNLTNNKNNNVYQFFCLNT